MTPPSADQAMREVEHLLAGHGFADWPDARLLERFVRCRDGTAFEALLQRHGSMVLRVCRAILPSTHDAEDAFQATFLVLACSATKVRNLSSVGSFLYGTAYRVALRAKVRNARRRAAELETAQMRVEIVENRRSNETLEATLHEELSRLPERYCRVLVLCHLEGRTHEQAARELGWPAGSVSRHLRRARELLRERLARRGVSLSAAGALVTGLTASSQGAVPTALVRATVRAVGAHVAGAGLVGGSGVPAVVLANEMLRSMKTFKLGGLAALALLIGVAGGTALFAGKAPIPAEKDTTPAATGRAPARDEVPEEGVDRHGDPLPPGAIARLGTVRLRHGGSAVALAFTRDGQGLVSVSSDFLLRLWHIPSGRELGRVPAYPATLNAVAISNDGKTLAVVVPGDEIALHDLIPARPREQLPPALGKERVRIKPPNGRPAFFRPSAFLAFRPDGALLGAAPDGFVTLWNANGKEVRQFGHRAEREEYRFTLSADGKWLAAGGKADVDVWDVDKGTCVRTLAGHQKVCSLAFAPDGKTLAVGDATNTIRLWDVAGRKVMDRLIGEKAPDQMRGYGDEVRALVFTPDGKTLISVGDYGDGTVRVWDVRSGKERHQLKGQWGDGERLALSPDGRTLAVAGMNNTVRLWDVTTGKALDARLGTQGTLYAVAVAPDGKEVATAGWDGVIRFWERATGRELRSLRAHGRQIHGLAYSPVPGRLFSCAPYEPSRLWDLTRGKEIRSFAGSTGSVPGVFYLCVSPDGRKLGLAADTIQLYAATGKIERVLAKGLIDRLAFSPDGRSLAGGGFDRMLHLWDLTTGKERWSVSPDTSIAAIAFAADGQVIAAGTYEKGIILYDTATGRELRRLRSESYNVRAVAISPDGRLLAASGDSNVVELYELATGQLVQRFQGHAGHVWSLAFAPDGRSLVSGSYDATALVWDLTGRDLAKKQRHSLADEDLEAHWTALGNTQAEEAHRAVLSLANAPKQAVALLRAHLAVVEPADAKGIAKWVADLDSDQFKVRQAASRELARLGKSVEAELRRARAVAQTLEARRRLDELLANIGAVKGDERLRSQRVVAVLELAATPEARELLERLARKGTSEDLRQRAQAALGRLAKRP